MIDGKWEREQERGEGSVPNVPAQFSLTQSQARRQRTV
jgi:hypothetical protein